MAPELMRAAAMAVVVVVGVLVSPSSAHVFVGSYNTTCPQVEDMVYKEMTAILAKSPDLAGPLLRLFSVDCFVGGCEGSILLDSTPGNTAEKDSPLNKGVRGYEVVDAIKAKLDAACPGIVSCSDTLALAARDVVRLTKGPYIPLPTGRRDGNSSKASDVAATSPLPGATVSDLITLFAKFNFTAKDLAVLSGAHTIGKAHCSVFSNRIYSNGNGDPTLDGNYTATLRGQCKANDLSTLVDLDPLTPNTFDADYYKQVASQRGLLATDAALLLNPDTKAYVLRQANATSPDEFFSDFIVSFVNMSKIGVLTHTHGEIRQKCSVVNPPSPSSSSAAASVLATSLAGSLLFLLAGALVLLF